MGLESHISEARYGAPAREALHLLDPAKSGLQVFQNRVCLSDRDLRAVFPPKVIGKPIYLADVFFSIGSIVRRLQFQHVLQSGFCRDRFPSSNSLGSATRDHWSRL